MSIQFTGLTITVLSTLLYLYYFIWLIITPLIDPGHHILHYFPQLKFAFLLPTVILLFGITVVGTFLGIALMQD